ncbi:MAG: hypothetical protein Athens041674_688 [Parcubacteria group bacterium Athens0416_74]|nr:MAG: hypothetical protein Athens041674_688 [Parcubacteria group bacterium Athens0416_74]
MNYQKAILITFLGNYLTNTVVAALIALIPASATPGMLTPQYISFVVLSALVVAGLAMWFGVRDLKAGAIFGVLGFVLALLVAFVSGVAGVLTQTGSLSQVLQVIPNFGPFLLSWSTLVLFGYWVIPSALIGWWNSRKASPVPAQM